MVQAPLPRPAATVVLVRPGADGLEVLLTQRPSTMAFAPDVHVFPGGAVDPGDADPRLVARSAVPPAAAAARMGHDLAPMEALAHHVAAIREVFEEAGILLVEPSSSPPAAAVVAHARARLLDGSSAFADLVDGLDLRLASDRLAPLSRWVTPRFVPRRFDTRFFAAELPGGIEPEFAVSEVVAHRWMRPSDALAARAAGEIDLWLPTNATLQQLEHASDFGVIERCLGPRPSEAIRVADEGPGLVRVVLPAAGGVAGQSVNAYVVGRRDLVVVDPGDPSEAALDAIVAISRRRDGEIRAVAVTHADPDHHAGAETLAHTLGVPIYAGARAVESLPFDATGLDDGERVPAGDVELRVVSTPGHRIDHVSYASTDGFVLAGDVIGPGPSRSILGPPDRRGWRSSLRRLDVLRPVRLLPGHGEPPPDSHAPIDDAARRLSRAEATPAGSG